MTSFISELVRERELPSTFPLCAEAAADLTPKLAFLCLLNYSRTTKATLTCVLKFILGGDENNRFGLQKYTGGRGGSSRNFPGLDGNAPLVIPHNSFTVRFISDGRYIMLSIF